MANDSNGGKTAYNYFYLELNEGYPMLLRSNYVHTQTLSTIEPIWRCADENVGFIERKSIYWKNRNDKAMWYKINSYEELLDAYNCVLNFELYQHKDRDSWNYRKQQEKREGQQSNSSSTQGYEELFFHGCEDLETLNARYRNLCKTFHPDGKSGDEESFKKMQQAYENMKRRMSA